MTSELVTVAAALIGALIGASGPVIGSIYQDHRREKRRARHLSLAVAAEISAVMEIVRSRRYIEAIRAFEAEAANGNRSHFVVRISRDYFPVTNGSLSDLGILPDHLPVLIPHFLTLAKSFLEDTDALQAGEWDNRSTEELRDNYHEIGNILEKAMECGKRIISAVECRYQR